MTVCSRSQDWPRSHDISVVSWNLLAECNYREDHVEGRVSWSTRLRSLRSWLSRFQTCDVLCCQEMDLKHGLPEVSEILRKQGFAMVVQERKGFPFVNVTFYKERRLQHKSSDHRSRILISCFMDNEGKEISIVNVHLQAGASQDNERQRVCQLASALKRTKGSTVVCGDFNSSFEESSELRKLMAERGMVRAPVKGITYASISGYSDTLDHIWSSPDLSAQLVSGSPTPELTSITLTGMPTTDYPSDHLPVAAAFVWQCQPKNLGLILASSAPLRASPEMVEEWANICWYADTTSGKQAMKKQKIMEKDFLQLLPDEEAALLQAWRGAAAEVAHTLVLRAGCQAVLKFDTSQQCFDPGGKSFAEAEQCKLPGAVQAEWEHELQERMCLLSLGGA